MQTKKWAGKKVQGTFSCFYADVDEFRCIANRARVDFTSLEPPEARKRLEDQCDTIERSNRKTCTVNIQFTYEESDIRQNGLFQMTVITAMAKQTARGAVDVPSYVQAFERRILGLARSTDLLLAHGRAGVGLMELAESQLEPFAPPDRSRLSISGPAVRLNVQAAQLLGMALHELATNAVKYGAFAGDTGRLELSWRLNADQLDMLWKESVAVVAPEEERIGFGTTVIKSMVGRSLGAGVERTLGEGGICWRFTIPLTAIDPEVAGEPEAEAAQ